MGQYWNRTPVYRVERCFFNVFWVFVSEHEATFAGLKSAVKVARHLEKGRIL
jgi:hypothetical protein